MSGSQQEPSFCPRCGAKLEPSISVCPKCGIAINMSQATGAVSQERQQQPQYQQQSQYQQPQYQQQQYQQQPQYQQPQYQQQDVTISPAAEKSKIAAGIFGIVFGGLGIHKFYLGYKKAGLIMLLVSIIGGILTVGVASVVIGIIGFIEGILYLTKSDQAFYQTYVVGTKEWF